MKSFGKTEFQILETIYRRDAEDAQDATLLGGNVILKEKDEMNRIRELVFHIEELERQGYLETEEDFYDSSDHMSFTYLNSATALREERVRLTEEGIRLIETFQKHHESGPIRSVSRVWGLPEGKTGMMYAGVFGFTVGILLGIAIGRFL